MLEMVQKIQIVYICSLNLFLLKDIMMKILKISLLFILSSVLFWTSCKNDDAKNDTNETVSAAAKLILPKSEKGLVRGLNFNASKEDVKAAEADKTPVNEDDTKIEYDFNSGTDKISVLYEFDTEGLYKVSISVKSAKVKDAKELEADLIKLLTAQFGELKTEGKFKFKEMPDKKVSVEISRKMKKIELIIKYFEL